MRTKFAFLSALFLLLVGQVVFAQVTGTVQDGDKFPVSDAEVTVRGGEASAVTDENGAFSIEAQVGDVLTVTDLLGGTQDFKVTKNNMGVLRFGSVVELGTVTLVGGIKVDPAQKIGAYDVIKKEDFELAPTASIDEVLNGRTSGLVFSTNSGDPGSTNIITIRGVGSLIGTPNPLYVIDGVVVGKGSDNAGLMESWNPLAAIDPNAIESVSVLKDASSTALYGARGANGVIVVTTKKGKYNQKTRFNFSSDMAVQSIAYDEQQFLNSEEFVKWGAIANLNANPDYAPSLQEAITRYSEQVGWDGVTDTNWREAILRNQSSVKTYNFSATGGSENTAFRIGGSYYDNQSLVKESKFDRLSLNSSVDHKITDKLTLGLNLNFSNVQRTSVYDGGSFRNPWTSQFSILPIYPIYGADGEYNLLNLGSGNDYFNPVAILEKDFTSGIIQTYIGSINAEYTIMDNLYFYSLFGVQYQALNEKNYWDPSVGDGRNQQIDPGDADFPDGLPGGIVEVANSRAFDWNWQNSLSYRKVFNEKHDFQVWAGMEYQEHRYNQVYSAVVNLSKPLPYLYFGANPQNVQNSDAFYEWKQISYFGRLNYIFDGKYTVSGQLRRDANSTLGLNEKSGIFWSVGGSWNAAKETFLNSESLNNLTFRVNYGEIGNIPYADNWGAQYNAYSLLGLSSYGGTDITMGIDRAGNPDLKWEVSKQLNIGVDVGLFNTFDLNVDLYDRRTVDAIYPSTIGGTNGIPASYYANIGEISNKGIETTLRVSPFKKGFRWDIYGNFSYNKNKIESLYADRPDAIERMSGNGIRALSVGREYAEYYVPLWAGVDPLTGEGQWWTDETRTEKTSDRSEATSAWLGKSPFPKYLAGLKNEFSYGGFSLSVFFTGQFDYAVHNMWQNFILSDGANLANNQIKGALYDSWSPENPNASNPKPIAGQANETQLLSDRWVRDGDHIRLKEARLAYSFGDLFKNSTGIDNLTLYVKGVNLWLYTFDDLLDFDPESNSNAYGGAAGKGLYDYTSPIMKSISLGVLIDF